MKRTKFSESQIVAILQGRDADVPLTAGKMPAGETYIRISLLDRPNQPSRRPLPDSRSIARHA